jgi:hypothetical protein
MPRSVTTVTVALLLASALTGAAAQVVRNPKLSSQDLAAAQAETRAAGGAEAELVYAARINAVEKGKFDSLVVIYAKPGQGTQDYFGLVAREGKKYRLSADQTGRALPSGDRFLKIGLKHEEGHSPLLRLIGATTEPGKSGEWQRNLDFQFNGSEFALVSQSIAQIAK